jgi:hypothetical protein
MLDVSGYGPHLAINRLLFAAHIDPAGYSLAATNMIKQNTFDTKTIESSDLAWSSSASKKRQHAFDQAESMLRASKGSTSKEQIRVAQSMLTLSGRSSKHGHVLFPSSGLPCVLILI